MKILETHLLLIENMLVLMRKDLYNFLILEMIESLYIMYKFINFLVSIMINKIIQFVMIFSTNKNNV